jgi:hypothetical protein
MGTRNVVAVVVDGQYKIAQYGQWDGYPDGQGADVLEFLRTEMNPKVFKSKVRALRFLTEDERKAEWAAAGADLTEEWVTWEVSARHKELYPQNSRDTGAGILKLVQDGPDGMTIEDEIAFVADSLFCEWVWVVDLDRNTFEGFEGFNKTPLGNGERFFFLQEGEPEYYPCKLRASFSLDKLPTKEEFLRRFEDDYDENEDVPLPAGISGQEPGLGSSVVKDNADETTTND